MQTDVSNRRAGQRDGGDATRQSLAIGPFVTCATPQEHFCTSEYNCSVATEVVVDEDFVGFEPLEAA
jgi:hypothetical protein